MATFEEMTEEGLFDELFTGKEMDVFDLLAAGKTNVQIAEIVNITERTLRFHVSNILKKLGAGNRTEAVVKAIMKGILDF